MLAQRPLQAAICTLHCDNLSQSSPEDVDSSTCQGDCCLPLPTPEFLLSRNAGSSTYPVSLMDCNAVWHATGCRQCLVHCMLGEARCKGLHTSICVVALRGISLECQLLDVALMVRHQVQKSCFAWGTFLSLSCRAYAYRTLYVGVTGTVP